MSIFTNTGFIATVAIVGVGCVIAAVVVPIVTDSRSQSRLNDELLVLSEESKSWGRFHDSRDDAGNSILFDVFLFNIENPTGILNGDTPVVTEVGPFRFTKHEVKTDYEWNGANFQFKPWEFVVDEDGVPLDSNITTLNLPFQSAVFSNLGSIGGRNALAATYSVIRLHTDRSRLFTEHTAQELIFGYLDEDIEFLNTQFPNNPISSQFPGYLRNMTEEEVMDSVDYTTIRTGRNRQGDVGRISEVDGSEFARYCPNPGCPPNDKKTLWASDDASRISGTDGSQFGHPLSTESHLSVYFQQFGRVIDLAAMSNQRREVKGLSTLRFSPDSDAWKSATEVPGNADFFQSGIPSGLLNLNRFHQMTAFLSHPHFLDADEELHIDGINPDPALHRTYFHIEPRLGITVNATKSYQFNVRIDTVEAAQIGTWFPDLESAYVPVFWVREESVVSDSFVEDASDIMDFLNDESHLSNVIQYVLYPIGAVLLFIATMLFIRRRREMKHARRKMYTPLDKGKEKREEKKLSDVVEDPEDS